MGPLSCRIFEVQFVKGCDCLLSVKIRSSSPEQAEALAAEGFPMLG